MGMIFVSIERNMINGKEYIRFCSNKECISMELLDRHLVIRPFPAGRIPNECIPDLIDFLIDSFCAREDKSLYLDKL